MRHDGEARRSRGNLWLGTASGLALAVTVAGAAAPACAQTADANELEQLIVTATKRETRLQDTPASIQVLPEKVILEQNLKTFDDYIFKMPSVQFASGGGIPVFGAQSFFLRGLTSSSAGGNTTGIYIDELPINNLSPPRLIDVARIEVLKGPQGTLFGEGSMGGIIRIITNQPKLGVFEGRVRGGASLVEHGDASYTSEVVVNAPITEQIAFRGGVYYDHIGGFIDSRPFNLRTTPTVTPPAGSVRKDANDGVIYGARAAFLWQPTENLSVTLSGWVDRAQQTSDVGVLTTTVPLEALYQFRKFDHHIEQNTDILNATVEYRLPFATLTSSTSYLKKTFHAFYDGTSLSTLLGFTNPNLPGQFGAVTYNIPEDRASEELRLVSTTEGPIAWTLGAFYIEKSVYSDLNLIQVGGPNTPGLVLPQRAYSETISVLKIHQGAIYGEVSYTLPIGLTATVGARYSDIEHSIFRGANGLPNFRSAFTAFAAKSKPWTYKAELSYRFKDFADFVNEGLLYANYREGFRNGFGITPPPPTCAAGLAALGLVANSQVDPDTVNTYEGGAKLTLKRGVVANMAIYHTDWDNIQSTFGLPCGFTISGNFGKAEIDGVEMDFAARPLEGLDVGISTAYTEAVYTQKAPGVSPSTNRLPFTPKWAVNANVRYTFPILDGQRSAYVAADAQYMSNRIYNSQGLARLREYHNLNLRAGVLMGAWDAQVYVQNVFDRYFIVGQPLAIPGENRVAPNRPRTIGVTATYHFQ